MQIQSSFICFSTSRSNFTELTLCFFSFKFVYATYDFYFVFFLYIWLDSKFITRSWRKKTTNQGLLLIKGYSVFYFSLYSLFFSSVWAKIRSTTTQLWSFTLMCCSLTYQSHIWKTKSWNRSEMVKNSRTRFVQPWWWRIPRWLRMSPKCSTKCSEENSPSCKENQGNEFHQIFFIFTIIYEICSSVLHTFLRFIFADQHY